MLSNGVTHRQYLQCRFGTLRLLLAVILFLS